MQTRERLVFAALKAGSHTSLVLKFHEMPWEGGTAIDFTPHIRAMLRLCEEQRLDDSPVALLRRLNAAMAQLRTSLEPGELEAAVQSASEYEDWLSATFPKAFDQMRKDGNEQARRQTLN